MLARLLWTRLVCFAVVVLQQTASGQHNVEVRSSMGYLEVGDNVTLTCILKNVPVNSTVTWYKLLRNDERTTVANRDKLTPPFMVTNRYESLIVNEVRSPVTNLVNVTAELRITRVQKEDEGTLGCRVANRAGTTTISVRGQILKMQIDQHRDGREINHLAGDTAIFDYPATEDTPVACHIEATTEDIDIIMTLNHIRINSGFTRVAQWRTHSGLNTGLDRRRVLIHYRSDAFSPTAEDDGRQLECIAHVRHSSSQLTTHVKLDVRHAPEGNCSAPQLVGSNVRVCCTARSNPSYEEATWSWLSSDGRQFRAPANESTQMHGALGCQDCSNRNVANFELVLSQSEFAVRSSYMLLVRNTAGSASFIVPVAASQPPAAAGHSDRATVGYSLSGDTVAASTVAAATSGRAATSRSTHRGLGLYDIDRTRSTSYDEQQLNTRYWSPTNPTTLNADDGVRNQPTVGRPAAAAAAAAAARSSNRALGTAIWLLPITTAIVFWQPVRLPLLLPCRHTPVLWTR